MSEPKEVGRFRDVDAVRDMLVDLYGLNAAITTGDIVSAKAALPAAEKLASKCRKALQADGLDVQYLQAFVAAGGFVGVAYSYAFPCGTTAQGNTVPRPIS